MITLAYSEEPFVSLAYDSDYEFQSEFNTLKYYETPITGVISGRTLRGRQFEHLIYRDTEFTIVISADELISSVKRNFIKEFWEAGHKYIRTDGDYIQVFSGGGTLPIEYINDNKYLPEITLRMTSNG